ncbi:MAG: hypothetical protein SFU25_06115 [Candidatus Caenarcaniphilales bacterium]|nr:hypothetical protein [Candidatus Caenarcaniphilales bacterium]
MFSTQLAPGLLRIRQEFKENYSFDELVNELRVIRQAMKKVVDFIKVNNEDIFQGRKDRIIQTVLNRVKVILIENKASSETLNFENIYDPIQSSLAVILDKRADPQFDVPGSELP